MSQSESVVVSCHSEAEVVRAIASAAATGTRLVARGGGHCFAGRSSGSGVVVDLSPLAEIRVDADGTAAIGAGARLGEVYRALHRMGRTLPAGCGATVGIAGLTLGGGIGLLGRSAGLTCDSLVGARVVLADGSTAECDAGHDPDLFWALRGAGGGQFGVVTSFRFATLPEPSVIGIDARWAHADPIELISAWQQWAPDAPDGMTLDLTVERRRGESAPSLRAVGASTLTPSRTRESLHEFAAALSAPTAWLLRGPVPFSALKDALADGARSSVERSVRIRSEFFERPLRPSSLDAVAALLGAGDPRDARRLTFTAMRGAYNRVARDATAFAHRGERFLLEHVGAPDDPWVDASWAAAHPDASGRVYPNFPDASLDDPLLAYHAENGPRLAEIKAQYDAHRFFDFSQAIRPVEAPRTTREGIRR